MFKILKKKSDFIFQESLLFASMLAEIEVEKLQNEYKVIFY